MYQLQPTQQPKLPQGWQAKWDPGSKRWFYINHSTKTTQWEIPQVQPQQTTTSFIDTDSEKVKVLMSEFDGVTEEYVRSILRVFNYNMASARRQFTEKGYAKKQPSNAIQPKEHFVKSLKSQFSAPEELIREVLVSTNNSVAGARMSLQAMGFQRKGSAPEKKAATEVKKPGTSSSNTKATSKTIELSEQAKRSRLQELKKKFPKVDSALIEMSLKGTMYDVNLASSILMASIKSVKSKTKSSATKASANQQKITSSSSSSYSSFSPPTSLEPVIFGAEKSDDKNTTKTTTTTTNAKSTTSSSLSTTTQKYTQPQKNDYLQKKRKFVAERRHAPVGGKVSSNRMIPEGPDLTMVNGPDYELLLKPNPANRSGPQASNRLGPQPSNRCGPQHSNRSGPLSSNRCGPLPSNAVGMGHIDVGPAHGQLLASAV